MGGFGSSFILSPALPLADLAALSSHVKTALGVLEECRGVQAGHDTVAWIFVTP